jgi:hypothetical protein
MLKRSGMVDHNAVLWAIEPFSRTKNEQGHCPASVSTDCWRQNESRTMHWWPDVKRRLCNGRGWCSSQLLFTVYGRLFASTGVNGNKFTISSIDQRKQLTVFRVILCIGVCTEFISIAQHVETCPVHIESIGWQTWLNCAWMSTEHRAVAFL